MLEIINAKNLKLPETADVWLEQLSGATVIEVDGHESNGWRVVSVLVHGNEPSGFFAAFEFLKQKIVPETNLAIVISSVRAARHIPVFTHRQIPGEYDLNRRFGILNCHDRVTELARQMTEYIRELCPELVVDLHNTSGSGPSFAVSINDHESIRKMSSLFTQRMVVTQLIVGSLMEQNFNCPIVTIECGGANDRASHKVALDGLTRFAKMTDFKLLESVAIETFMHPMRIRAHRGMALEFADQKDRDVDITLVSDIEQFNYQVLTRGSCIGWLSRCLTDCLEAINDQGEDIIKQMFELDDGQLIAKKDMRVFMATSRADIALSDCLFYVVPVEH